MKKQLLAGAVLIAAGVAVSFQAPACTGLGLMSKDGSYVMARTMEWAGGYVPYGYVVIPRGEEIISYTPTGQNGVKFKAKYGVVGIAPQQKEFIIEGLNETGEQFIHSRASWAIVSPETFQKAQEIMADRRIQYNSGEPFKAGRYSCKHLFSTLSTFL